MTPSIDNTQEPVRLLFEMTRDDNPRLYDDLIRFNKGTKRVNRLRFLAYEGLLAQSGGLMPGSWLPAGPSALPLSPRVNTVVAGQLIQAFDVPSAED